MNSEYSDELDCDFAQYYGILDRRQLSIRKAAILADGLLSIDSRLKRAISGAKQSSEIVLLASAVDRLTTLVWFQTEDGRKGRNRPKSVLAEILGEKENKSADNLLTFDSAEGFEAERNRLLKKVVA